MANATTEAESNDSCITTPLDVAQPPPPPLLSPQLLEPPSHLQPEHQLPQNTEAVATDLQPDNEPQPVEDSPVVQIKKERNVDLPVVTTPVAQTSVSNPIQSASSAAQDDQLRLLLQQETPASTPISRPSSASSAVLNHSRANVNPVSGQRTIDSYFAPRTGSVASVASECKQDDERKTPPVDLESVRGIFGWTTLEGVHIPFILRGEDRFTAVRIIEKTLLKRFLQALPPDVYSCTYIKSYFITDNEAKLLNEINIKHCDRQYGNELFSSKDLVVLLNDVEQLYEFLSTCYYKLIRPTASLAHGAHSKIGKCGIVKVEGNAIPYVLRNDVRYVPLSVFDQSSAIKAFDLKAEKLESWEMSYVKFCCKVANISHDFLQQDSCLVVSLDDLQQTFGINFRFEEWWPSALPVSSSVSNSNLAQQQQQQSKVEKESSKYSLLHQRNVDKLKNDSLQQNSVQRCSRVSQQQQPPSLPRALPASGWYDPGSGVITDAIRGPISSREQQQQQQQQLQRQQHQHQAIAAKAVANSRTVSSQNLNGNQNSGVPSTTPSYTMPELLPPPAFQLAPTLPLSKLQAYLYSGQYWGAAPSYLQGGHTAQIPMVYPTPTLEPAYVGRTSSHQGSEHRRVVEHSMNGKNSSNLVQSHSSMGRMPSKSNYTMPIQNNQVASALMLPPMLHVNSDIMNRDRHKEPNRTQEEQRSPFYPDGQYRGLPKVASSDHTVASSILNGSRDSSLTSNGNRTPTMVSSRASTSGNANYVQNLMGDSFLAKHLLGMNRTSPRLENFVVAPGSVQSLTGKMSSPKPANQVPAHVSNYHNYRVPVQLDASSSKTMTTVHQSSSAAASLALMGGREVGNSKLHQLLSSTNVDHVSLEPQDLSIGSRSATQGSSKSRLVNATASHLDAGGYEVQHLNVSGIKFRAIITVMSHSKGPPMVPLSELERRISPRIQADYYEQILTQGLGIRLYSCSRGQLEILKKYVNCSQDDKSSLLICGDDLKRCLPHLQQISCTMTKLRTPHLGDAGVQSKRLRLETEAVT